MLLLDPDTDRLVMVRQFRVGLLWQPECPGRWNWWQEWYRKRRWRPLPERNPGRTGLMPSGAHL